MLKKLLSSVCLLLGAWLWQLPALAIELNDVPEPLKPWVTWALHGEQQAGCPFYYSDAGNRRCAWGSALELKLEADGGRFSQRWQAQRAGWAPLPGDAQNWPQTVMLNGKPAAVAERNGLPMLWLPPGSHQINGAFIWPRLPETLQLAPATGLVDISLNGRALESPYLDEQARLWLQREATASTAEDHLELRVHRLLDDDIPARLTTRLQLSVSGKPRELLLAPALLADFTPISLQSPLPARLEADGKLRVQARAGDWQIILTARHDGPLAALALPPSGQGTWVEEEVWAFEAHNPLRLVTIEGAPAIDPQQTTLPEEWKRFPAYRMTPGATLKLIEKKRGDPDPAPDQLSLHRRLWLDFDGGGFTAQDRINGAINRSWRLDMAAPAQLGRVEVDGQAQMITQGKDGAAGIELRQGRADIVAESRFPHAGKTIAAVAWRQDFQNVTAELQLPLGWKLLATRGVDSAPGAWLAGWNLLDIFLALVVAFAASRLWGWRWGLLALLMMALVYPEAEAPQWIWLNLLAAAALIRYLPAGNARRVALGYRALALISLLLIALPFAVQQIRVGLYPSLEMPGASIASGVFDKKEASTVAVPNAVEVPKPAAAPLEDGNTQNLEPAQAEARAEMDNAMAGKSAVSAPAYDHFSASVIAREKKFMPMKRQMAEHDPNARIQTGPGLPEWSWNSYALRWSGPVRHDQTLQLWLLSPNINLLLAFLRVILVAALAWRMLDRPLPSLKPHAASVAMLLLLLGIFTPMDRVLAGEQPTPELLEQLRQRLTQPPPCLPLCASSPRMQLEVKGGVLRLRQQIDTLEDVAVPLPGGDRHWRPQHVIVDGESQPGLLRQGDNLWLRLPKGSHQVLLEGSLGARDNVEIPLPLRPHLVTAAVEGWSLEGVRDDGRPEDNLRLKRERRTGDVTTPQSVDNLPPFVLIERTLQLGLKWQVETRIIRLSPPGVAVVLQVPLLPGEAVVSEWVQSKDGQAQVSMAPNASELSWSSTLQEAPRLTLQAAKQNQWAESWQVDASPIWHVEFNGLAPVAHQSEDGQRRPSFRPWPGEQLTLDISRPQAVPGQTLTIDSSFLTVKPGRRDTDTTLQFRLRSSQGGQHAVTLPADAELLNVSIDNQPQPIRAQSGKLTLPVVPGMQNFSVSFRQPHGIAWRTTTPAPDIGSPSVNTHITVEPPQDRWILFLNGPRLGPAVLFWGVLLVLAMLSWALGKVPLTPLKAHHWLLLGVGLTQTPPETALIIAGWLLALGWRGRDGASWNKNGFNLMQIALGVWTLAALGALFYAIQHGLLGLPEMQIAGNGSSASSLNWFQDRSAAVLPQAWLISVPLWVYRALMLVWALWLAAALMSWLRWGWGCYTAGGIWKKLSLAGFRTGHVEKEAKPGSDGKA